MPSLWLFSLPNSTGLWCMMVTFDSLIVSVLFICVVRVRSLIFDLFQELSQTFSLDFFRFSTSFHRFSASFGFVICFSVYPGKKNRFSISTINWSKFETRNFKLMFIQHLPIRIEIACRYGNSNDHQAQTDDCEQ